MDLWLEDDFNAPSRMPAGRPYGARENVAWSGKEAADTDMAVNTVSILCVRAERSRIAASYALTRAFGHDAQRP